MSVPAEAAYNISSYNIGNFSLFKFRVLVTLEAEKPPPRTDWGSGEWSMLFSFSVLSISGPEICSIYF
jgi:hypothetical protein